MPEPDLAAWQDIVRRSSRKAGHRLSADTIEELASHLADVYVAERDRGRSEPEARAIAMAAAERAAYEDVVVCARATAAADSHLLDRVPSRASRLAGGLAFDVHYAFRSMRRQPAFTLALLSILAVAKRMISLSGASGIEVVFTGLRPGEKLHEALFGESEDARPTDHPLIRTVRVPSVNPSQLTDLASIQGHA